MRANLAKSTWLIASVLAILLLVASPSMAAASMERMTEENCDFNPCQGNTAMPLCCQASDCPLSYCISPNTSTHEVLLCSRFTANEEVCLSWSPISLAPEPPSNQPMHRQRDSILASPSDLFTAYHCRNCLSSEEPSAV